MLVPTAAVPAVEFVRIADRLPQFHPGLWASAIVAALLAFLVWWACRWNTLP